MRESSRRSDSMVGPARLLLALEQLLAREATDLAGALAAAAPLVEEVFAAATVEVFLHDAATDAFVARSVRDTPLSHRVRAYGLEHLPGALGERITAVFRTGQPFQTGLADRDPQPHPGVTEEVGIRSLLAVPLDRGGDRYGVLLVAAAPPAFFPADALPFLQAVARWVGLVTQRPAWAGAQETATDGPTTRATRLATLTTALAGALTLTEVADAIMEHGLAALDARVGVVALLSADGTLFHTVRTVGYPGEIAAAWPTFPATAPLPIPDAVRAREPVVLPSFAERAARYPAIAPSAAPGTRGALVALPLLVRGQAIGGLGLTFPTTRRFTTEEHAYMQTLADLCAQALERTRLYDAERAARAAAVAERDRLRRALDLLPEGVVLADGQGRVTLSNAVARALLGADLEGRTLPTADEPAPPDGDAPGPGDVVALSRALVDGEGVQGAQLLVRHRDTGRVVPLLLNAAPLHDAAGVRQGAVAVFQDITALQDLERAREEFLSAVAHDLKTPLTSVRGYTQLAQTWAARHAPTEATLPRYLSEIAVGTRRLLDLIDELADATRARLGEELLLQRLPTDVVALTRGVVAQQSGLTAHRLRVETALPHLDAAVDAPRLERVVGNLLTNALKYSPAGGDVTVRVTREGDSAVIAVQDQGLGIPAADLPHIFALFRRGGNVGAIPGTGIGLAGARHIVEAHGGTLTAQSVDGAGSTFTLRLPLHDPTAPVSTRPPAPPAPGSAATPPHTPRSRRGPGAPPWLRVTGDPADDAGTEGDARHE